jgi:uncharacterized surface protein with fasciclin (FAS1) repeats
MTRTLILSCAAAALAACQPAGEQGNDAAAMPQAGTSAGGNAAGGNAAGGETGRTLAESIARSQDHGRLNELVEAAGLAATLRGAGPYTLFAPTDAAIEALPEAQRAPEERERLATLLAFHLVPGTVTAEDIGRAVDQAGGRAEIATVGGANLSAARDGDAIVLSGAGGTRARIVAADQIRSNGVLHSVDGVLLPE